jgi:hypothetical protein
VSGHFFEFFDTLFVEGNHPMQTFSLATKTSWLPRATYGFITSLFVFDEHAWPVRRGAETVADAFHARMFGAMRTAINGRASLDSMSQDVTPTMRTPWRHGVNRTFETVESHGSTRLRVI